ncbi:endonuclease domain-containing protein [Patescibacteria group bacterium]|nr:MAG: endonuclease domain-containing protein [Patescibacteria group bacterium]
MKLVYNQSLKPLAQNLRRSGNLSEVLLWNQIKSKKLGVKFLRQKPVDKYIIDFYCNELNLAIEIDGVSHDAKVESDVERQNMLESKGIRFLRFSDTEVKRNIESVVKEIKEFINNKIPPFQVLPLKRENNTKLCLFK